AGLMYGGGKQHIRKAGGSTRIRPPRVTDELPPPAPQPEVSHQRAQRPSATLTPTPPGVRHTYSGSSTTRFCPSAEAGPALTAASSSITCSTPSFSLTPPMFIIVCSAGGIVLIRSVTKLLTPAPAPLPFAPPHITTLSKRMLLIASAALSARYSIFSSMRRRYASSALPHAATIRSRPSAFFDSFSYSPRASASSRAKIAAASPSASSRLLSASASAST